jgi:hypothetical protein
VRGVRRGCPAAGALRHSDPTPRALVVPRRPWRARRHGRARQGGGRPHRDRREREALAVRRRAGELGLRKRTKAGDCHRQVTVTYGFRRGEACLALSYPAICENRISVTMSSSDTSRL